MAFERICALNDVWEGEMQVFEIGGKDVLVINGEGGIVRAVDARCPHQDHPLGEGTLEGRTLTCNAHLWQFDIESGAGVNPTGCSLKMYPVKVVGDDILIDVNALQSA